MQAIDVPGLGFRCSRFVFGTASLFNVGSAARRRALLDAAVDQGFSHFDAAPLYGFGHAERDLAPLLRAHPRLTVTTKVGLYPPGGAAQPGLAVLLRKAGGRLLRSLSAPRRSFDLARAQASLEGSLRRLGRERIDLYLLHEPEIALLDAPRWLDWLRGRVAAGQVGRFGVAGPAERLAALLQQAPELAAVAQLGDSLDRREADLLGRLGRPLQLTYGYLSAAARRGDARPASELLRLALQRNPGGAIVVSTTRLERLGQYRQLAEAGT